MCLLRTLWRVIKYMLIFLLFREASILIFSFLTDHILTSVKHVNDVNWIRRELIKNKTAITYVISAVSSLLVFSQMIKRKKMNIYEICHFTKLPKDKAIISFIAGIALIFCSSIVLAIIRSILPAAYESHAENINLLTQGGTFQLLLFGGIIAPLFEEVMIRGLIFNEFLKTVSIKKAILAQAIIFGILHFNLTQGVYTTILGIFYGLAFYWTGSIWSPVLMHMSGNLFTLGMSIIGQNIVKVNPIAIGVITVFMLFCVFVLTPYTFSYLYRKRVTYKNIDR
ncbi:CPBP family intramembrane glutamic endopeptidase [Alkaliphilus serpentinus]|uniref:CPBP family intramembrane metalloprotease n=1 Tax=Alkaliphilus serpentinus TaxID=1482731 RepID=A0A833M8V3_9FIRM|nr:CPBP family intramembrane glutamic endopeptidase [Alkaliphilus serpentinus]KAB3531776.1 CPBP family intramembrane metalloprotease [Alkaliphilus serpentinus]